MNEVKVNVHGVEIARNVVSRSDIDEMIIELRAFSETAPGHGIRNADKKIKSICRLSKSTQLISMAKSILGSKPHVVRVILFDKTPDKNWLVSWHQDKTISLRDKVEIPGWGPWSIKDNMHHVQPTLDV
ncbi:MAG: hypothetical protein ACC657_18510, partial [Thiohalomonadales bacterium]